MNIIIVGCGKVGENLAAQLNDENSNITVIDILPERVKDVAGKYDIMGVVGNGASHAVLSEARIKRADLLIAVTGSDELNILCCLIAKKLGNCQTIARLENPEYSDEANLLKEELGLAMVINPQHAAAEEIARILRFPAAISIETFGKGKVELMKFRLPEDSPLVGMSVWEIVTRLRCNILVCTVEREDGAHIANGNFVFKENDIISIVGSPKNASDFFKKIRFTSQVVKDAMIVGGGEITQYLCKILQRSGIELKVIDKNRQICEELSTQFEGITVINGDAQDKSTLIEEGIATASAFIPMTNIDEENILLSLFARSMGGAKLITKINRADFDDVIKPLELDSVIYPKSITANMIVRYVRAMRNSLGCNVETLYDVIKDKVEAAEFYIKDSSAVVGVPLSELKLKPNLLIASILRGKGVIIPRGSDTIELGDRVIVVSESITLSDITDILK